MEDIKKLIRSIPNFPKEGIIFRDITTLIKDKDGLKLLIEKLIEMYKDKNIDYVVGAESRGFIFGAPLAYGINAGFIPVRKQGKLPYKTISESYELEYGESIFEIHEDAIEKGKNILIIDDLLATGGTGEAVIKLVERLGGIIKEIVFIIELKDLTGREKLSKYNVDSLIKY